MNQDITTINSLIATTIDSVNGYEAAMKNADNQQFRTIFADRARERREIVSDLQAYVRDIGGDPEKDGTTLAGAHRFFMNLRDSVASDADDTAVIAEVERGEDHIKAKYEDALAVGELSSQSRETILQAFGSVKSGHDQMRDLKNATAGVSLSS